MIILYYYGIFLQIEIIIGSFHNAYQNILTTISMFQLDT